MPPRLIRAPGRVNLIGEHIDYHNLPVLPMALEQEIRVLFEPRADRIIRIASAQGYPPREFLWEQRIEPYAPGDWGNYAKAAAQAVAGHWGVRRGIEATVDGNIAPAAGLSSSSALVTAFSLALLDAAGIAATFEELMAVLPEGEHYVGTRGGGMDHAACLAGREGHALYVEFSPVRATPVPVPSEWRFFVAHSLVRAEKSSARKEEYNARRQAGRRALERLGASSYRALLAETPPERLPELAARLEPGERRAFRHVTSEALRVEEAAAALRNADAAHFGELLDASHASLRDDLGVSCPALDELTAACRAAGAWGARVTGAGFGGCAVALVEAAQAASFRRRLEALFYASRPERREFPGYLIETRPAAGALAHLG